MGVLTTIGNFLTGSTPAGVVAQASGTVLGELVQGVTKVIEEFHLPPEQEAALKLQLANLHMDAYKAALADTDSARRMQEATRSWWPGLLSLVTVVGFFGAGWYVIHWGIPTTSAEGRDVIIQWTQTLYMGIGLVYGYWLGASHTEQKNALMNGNAGK